MEIERQKFYFEWVPIPTAEGTAYLFIGLEHHSQFLFELGVVSTPISDELVFAKVVELVKHKDFTTKPFELVIGGSLYLKNKIEKLITPLNGKLTFDEQAVDEAIMPILKEMFQTPK